MSDLWTFSSSSPPPLAQSPPFVSSPPPFRNHGNHPHPKVSSPHHLTHPQVSSPHHLVTSPHHLTHPQVTSPHHFPHSQVTSPHHFTHPQVSSPHLLSPPQVTSPHLLPPPQVTSPHHFVPQSPQAPPSYPPLHQSHGSHHLPYSPHPHLLPPQHQHQHQLSDPGLDHQHHQHQNWIKSESPSDAAACLNSFSYGCQNPATAHLDLQHQNQYNTGVNDTHRLPYSAHTLLGGGGVYGPGQDAWGVGGVGGALEPSLSQLQCSPLGSQSGTGGLGRWSSMDFSSPPPSAQDFSNSQFFPDDSYHDNGATQAFCSPTTPGPSPHHPHTPTVSSPAERLGFHTPQPLSRDQNLGCCLHEPDGFESHQNQTGRRPPGGQTEPIQDQTNIFSSSSSCCSSGGVGGLESSFSPQGGGGQNATAAATAAQSPGLAAGPGWREECGAGGGGGGGGGEPDWTWMKRPQPENSTKPLDCRLLCTVCKRDFRSLPALNGHMRSHSGFRSAAWVKKGDEPSPPVQPSVPASVSMVMPVSVPIRSRGGASKASRGSGQRRLGHVPAAATRAAAAAAAATALYRSLMRPQEEEKEKGEVRDGEAVVRGDGGHRGHYTPPPMLCPLRAAAGLFCSLTSRRQQRVETVQLHNTHNGVGDLVAVETTLTTGIDKPRINVGRSFQAEVPPLQRRKQVRSDSQNALLVWTPWEELETPVNQQRVAALLTMARSSVVPGGGASPEHALRVLSECRGDFLSTVEKLLSSPGAAAAHAGVSWSAAEMKLLVKSLQLHHKDFSSVQKTVRTKSLSQCVEFYYLWKKKLGLSVRTPAGLTVTLPEHK